MKYSIKIIFGKEQVNKFISEIPLSEEEFQINMKKFFFETEPELIAFKKGIDEAIGWMECFFVESDFCLNYNSNSRKS
jgi:hypothetical protein